MPETAIEALSDEFALACTPDGTVTWCDERARKAISISPGDSIAALAAPGTAPQMDALLARARERQTREWELTLEIGGRPVTVAFNGMPKDGGVLLVGKTMHRGRDELMRLHGHDAGHDLRAPLHAILVLARLLNEGADGPLTAEQSRQVNFIRKSAEDLLRLVDDVFDPGSGAAKRPDAP